MSRKNSITKSDYIPWNQMLELVDKLYKDEKYVFSLFILMGSCLGLRISNLREVTWKNLLYDRQFLVYEYKTKKTRNVRVNNVLYQHAKKTYEILNHPHLETYAISGRWGSYSVQYLNRILKQIKDEYGLQNVEHISTHSLRKTFGRHVVEKSKHPEMELIRLSELFNHANTFITRIYLGITKDELLNIYDELFED